MVDLHKYLENNRILLAKVINLIDYSNSESDQDFLKTPKMQHYNDCLEINNFKKRKNGKVYGFVCGTNGKSDSCKISIGRLGASKTDTYIKNCLVIFISDNSEIVGYYKNATIFREYQSNRFSNKYCFETIAKNAILLPYYDRIKINLKKGKSFLNFGEFFRKYIGKENRKYISELLTKLENYKNESKNIYQETNGISVSERKVLVPHLKTEGRIPQNKVKEIKKIKGYTCEVCGFNFSDHYKYMKNSNFIELHHLNMYANLKDNEIRKLKETDFAVLCPNCHRMIHRLKNLNNDSSDIEQLKKLYKK